MDNKQLPKEHVFQESNSFTCGPCCLAMVYAFKGKNITLTQILKDFKHPKRGKPTYAPQLGIHLEQHGIKTRITISSSKIVSLAWKGASREDLIKYLTDWIPFHKTNAWKKDVEHVIAYLQAGGPVTIDSYSAQTVKEMIDRGSLVILCIDEDWAWGHRFKMKDNKREVNEIEGKLEGHFVLVTGYSDNTFHVLDPFPTYLEDRHGEYDIDVNQLLNASLTWDPEIIEVLS